MPKHPQVDDRVRIRELPDQEGMNPMTAITASATMEGESNQSRSLPLSSMICSAPTQVMSNARPVKSTGMRWSPSRAWRAGANEDGDHNRTAR